MDVVRDLRVVFPLRGTEHETGQLTRAHFKALRKYPLSAVRAGAETGLLHWKHFPKPAEWIDAIPRRVNGPVDVPVLSDSAAREYRRAEAMRWQDEPCRCAACVAAHVCDQPVRFVPEFNDDGRDRKVKDPIGDRIVTAGHWAHGQELLGYWLGRERFFSMFKRVVATHEMPR